MSLQLASLGLRDKTLNNRECKRGNWDDVIIIGLITLLQCLGNLAHLGKGETTFIQLRKQSSL